MSSAGMENNFRKKSGRESIPLFFNYMTRKKKCCFLFLFSQERCHGIFRHKGLHNMD